MSVPRSGGSHPGHPQRSGSHSESVDPRSLHIPSEEDATLTSGLEELLERAGTGDISTRDLQKALAEAHQTIVKQRRELLHLKTENADLALKQKRGERDTHADQVDKDVKKLARYFQLFYSPYIDLSVFHSTMKKPNFEHDHQDRYANEATATELGLTAKVYHCVSPKFYTFMAQSTHFKKMFGEALSDSRSLCLDRLRTASPKIFEALNIPASYFEKPSKKGNSNEPVPVRMIIDAARRLLTDKKGAFNHTAHFPAILYKNGDFSKVSYLFLNSVLFEVSRITLYGPKSGKIVGGGSLQANSPYAREDRGVRVTPGLIAWAAIMSRFLLSNDTEFTSTGVEANSGHLYRADFDRYKKIIIDSHEENPAWYAKLMKIWTYELFSAKKHALNEGQQNGDSGEDFDVGNEVDDIMQQMRGENLTSSESESELDEHERPTRRQPAAHAPVQPLSPSTHTDPPHAPVQPPSPDTCAPPHALTRAPAGNPWDLDDDFYVDEEPHVNRNQAPGPIIDNSVNSVRPPSDSDTLNTLGLEMLIISSAVAGSSNPEPSDPEPSEPEPSDLRSKPKPKCKPTKARVIPPAPGPGLRSGADPANTIAISGTVQTVIEPVNVPTARRST
ncbi:hypothetical protein M413DRAFT_29914 [Hebeloma cylindrosporum]|uniref:Uncharacterized protein n=1 Tax=Hebeloma cylindrosporum TaxID=76867 RepID=A0A0C3BPX3_HEBCY|nr:hypothetical protein M413DRAFT_29914 [Hebeloma cylindrosporum h7]